jgi:hypothetical protein
VDRDVTETERVDEREVTERVTAILLAQTFNELAPVEIAPWSPYSPE